MQLKMKNLGVCLILLFWLVLSISSCSQSESKSEEIRSIPKSIYITDYKVLFYGRWQTISETGHTKIPKINAVEGACFKERMICIESIACINRQQDDIPIIDIIGKNILYAIVMEYRIIEWSPTLIRAIVELDVIDIELRISISDKIVERSFRETKARGSDIANPEIYAHWILE